MVNYKFVDRTVLTILLFFPLAGSAFLTGDGTGGSIVVACSSIYLLAVPFMKQKWNARKTRYLVLFFFVWSLALGITSFFEENSSVELSAAGSSVGLLACLINILVQSDPPDVEYGTLEKLRSQPGS